MITYKIIFSFNLGNVVDKVGELTQSLNSTLATFGITEKLHIRSHSLSMLLQCNHELKTGDKLRMRDLFISQINADFPNWQFRIESFRRQPGNSRSQSESR